MNILIRLKIGLIFFVAMFTLNLEANPVLARQYDMACSACHSQVPALNDMGLSFVRNGFRTSKYDPTALKSFLDDNSSKRHYPIGAMIGLSDNSHSDQLNRLVKLYLSGSLTDSISLMALTKEVFNDKDDQKLFQSNNSQLYLQYNYLEAKHVFRAGLLSPFTQLGNIHRSMGHSGLHISAGHGEQYFSPLQYANVKQIKGAEYSYLTDNNILILFSYGNAVEDSSSQHCSGHGEGTIDEKGENAFLSGITYKTDSNYKIGLVYNYNEMDGYNQYSFIVPIEKEYEHLIWNSSLVYANDSNNDYIGMENAFSFPLRDMEYIKAIVNVDRDENDQTNFGYSIGYTKVYNMFYFGVVAGRVNTDTFSQSKVSGSINLIF